MNKQNISKELSDIGIKVKSIKFTATGYLVQMRRDTSYNGSWEDFENLFISGFEVVRGEQISRFVRQIVIIPANEREFKDYIRRYVKSYNLDEDFALLDLTCIVEKYGSISARTNFNLYKSVMIRRRSNESR